MNWCVEYYDMLMYTESALHFASIGFFLLGIGAGWVLCKQHAYCLQCK